MPDGASEQTPESIADLLGRIRDIEAAFPPLDPLRHFHSVYTRTTQAVADEIRMAALGGFLSEWVERWDVAFAQLYLRALDSWTNDRARRPDRGRSRSARRPSAPTRRRFVTCCSGSTPTSTTTCRRRCWR